jgi:ketosteroid isomerase-like protein
MRQVGAKVGAKQSFCRGTIMAKGSSTKPTAEINKIKASNEAYYKALSARDMQAMAKVWTCAADNILIAPPGNPRVHVGWSAIKRNWAAYWHLPATRSPCA